MISGKRYLVVNQRHRSLGPRTCHMTDDVGFFVGWWVVDAEGREMSAAFWETPNHIPTF